MELINRRLAVGMTILAALALSVSNVTTASASVPVTQVTGATTRQSPARVRCVNCAGDSTRRVLVIRLDSLRSEFERRSIANVQNEVIAREINATLMALQEFFETSPRRIEIRRMEPDVERAIAEARRNAEAAAGAVGYAYSFQTGQKRGYLGVVFDGPSQDIETGRDRIIRFFQYPKIASVDPSSPAERAGILVGDTVLAFNGIDVIDRAFSLTKLLVPDEKFTMKVRRQGDAKEFRIVVGEAPSYAIARAIPIPPAPRVAFAPATPGAAPAPPSVQVFSRAPAAAEAPRTAYPQGAETRPVAPAPAAIPRMYFLGNAIAGARFEMLDADNERLGKLLGSQEGLLVMSVVPGSLAEFWGIRDGDIVLSADGQPMRTIQMFRRVVAERDRSGDQVKLVVLRDKKKVDLVIK